MYLKLYSSLSTPSEAFFLEKGKVYFFISETDKYLIKGNNLIVGSSEMILNKLGGITTSRLETAITDKESVIKKIPESKFFSSLNNFSFLINTCMVLAKQVFLSNGIINTNLNSLEGNEKKLREISTEYYRIVSHLQKEYNRRRLPWLQEIIKKYETSLLYKRGEALERTADPIKISSPIQLSDTTVEYEKDSIICEEGSVGEEMYILQSGAIDVYINNTRVATISETGYVFGEMALLLREKRTATLKAKNNVVITRLQKENLRSLAQEQSDILISLATSLAKKHYYNTEKIKTVNTLLIEKNLSMEDKNSLRPALDLQRSITESESLKHEIDTAYNKRDADFLKELI